MHDSPLFVGKNSLSTCTWAGSYFRWAGKATTRGRGLGRLAAGLGKARVGSGYIDFHIFLECVRSQKLWFGRRSREVGHRGGGCIMRTVLWGRMGVDVAFDRELMFRE